MKNLVLAIILTSYCHSAFASENYVCEGLLNKKDSALINLEFESMTKVRVISHDGNVFEFLQNRENKVFKYYGDYNYDGYGGYIDLRVPQSFEISTTNVTEQFEARFQTQTFSELGHVGSEIFKGSCQRLK